MTAAFKRGFMGELEKIAVPVLAPLIVAGAKALAPTAAQAAGTVIGTAAPSLLSRRRGDTSKPA
jgi:hypothetical protein